ncbi:MAG TPA: hypothetical protein VF937_01145 [Chloroflexota bacterium]
MRRAVVGVCCCLGAIACTARVPPAPTPTGAPAVAAPSASPPPAAVPVGVQQIQVAPQAASAARVIASPSPAALPLAVLAGRSGGDLRVALDLLLQENAFLAASSMDAAASARLDELIGSTSALDQNSLALAETVGAVRGQPTAEAVLDAWRGAMADLVAYAQGQQSSAIADLDRRRAALASELAAGDLSESVADDILRGRLQSQLALADSIVGRDPTLSAQRLRSLAAGSDDLGGRLAAALAAQVAELAPPSTEGGDVEVRVHLTLALQQHVYLTAAAIAAGADGRLPEQQVYVAAADQDAADLGGQLGSVYGADLGTAVADRLGRETAAFVSAASGGDRQQSASDIDRARADLDQLLSTVNQMLPPGLLIQQLRASDQPLLTAADAFVARDFTTAFARVREAARQAQKPADTLAVSIVDRYPGRYLVLPTPSPAGR